MQRVQVPRLYAAQQNSEDTMQREADHVESLRNTKISCMRRHQKQGGQRPSGPSCRHPWPDSEIRIFLKEWKVVERIPGHPGSKIYQKSWALYQRLNGHRGLKKSWESCVDLLLTLQNLHRRLCNGRGDTMLLFSPFSEDLYSILGHSPCPLYHEEFGNHLPPMNPQTSRDQLGDHGIPGPSAQLQGNPLPVMSQGDSLFLRRETQNHCCLSSVPHLLPASDSGIWEDMVNFLELETMLQFAERKADHVESLRNTKTSSMRWLQKQEGQRPSGPLYREAFGNHLHPENPQPSRGRPDNHGIPDPSV